MNTGRFLRIANGDYFRPESVIAVTARDSENKHTPAEVAVLFKHDQQFYIECKSFEKAKGLCDEIMKAINNHFVD